MRGRPPVLSAASETQLARLLDAGVTQELAARVVGCSRRTVARYAARRRAGARPESLVEALAVVNADVDAMLAGATRPATSRRGDWREAAAALDELGPWQLAERGA